MTGGAVERTPAVRRTIVNISATCFKENQVRVLGQEQEYFTDKRIQHTILLHVRIWMQLFSVPFSGRQWYPFPKKPGLHVETKGMIATVFILIMRYHPNKVLDLYLHMHWNLPDFPSKLHTAFSWQISPPSRRQSRPPSARWHSVPGP